MPPSLSALALPAATWCNRPAREKRISRTGLCIPWHRPVFRREGGEDRGGACLSGWPPRGHAVRGARGNGHVLPRCLHRPARRIVPPVRLRRRRAAAAGRHGGWPPPPPLLRRHDRAAGRGHALHRPGGADRTLASSHPIGRLPLARSRRCAAASGERQHAACRTLAARGPLPARRSCSASPP